MGYEPFPASPSSLGCQVYLSAEKVLLSTAEWTPPVSWSSVENVPSTGRIKAAFRHWALGDHDFNRNPVVFFPTCQVYVLTWWGSHEVE